MTTISAALAGGMLLCTAATTPLMLRTTLRYHQHFRQLLRRRPGQCLGRRAIGDALAQKLDATVVVENKPGANGLLAAQTLAQGEPNGHNLLLVTDAMHLPQ